MRMWARLLCDYGGGDFVDGFLWQVEARCLEVVIVFEPGQDRFFSSGSLVALGLAQVFNDFAFADGMCGREG